LLRLRSRQLGRSNRATRPSRRRGLNRAQACRRRTSQTWLIAISPAQLFEYEIGSGQDSQLKNFAAQTLPILMRHLEMAQNIDARLTGAALR
jgi:hypothetical protein